MGLIIAADVGSLGAAAGELSAAMAPGGHATSLPVLGHSGAEAALGDFADSMHRYAARLADAAAQASHAMTGYAYGFTEAAG